jgi:hypothetical protein
MIEYSDGNPGIRKRAKIEIDVHQTVGHLYQKVASLVGADTGDFRLVLATVRGCVDLTNLEETIGEADCPHSFLRVLPV